MNKQLKMLQGKPERFERKTAGGNQKVAFTHTRTEKKETKKKNVSFFF